MHNKRGGGGLVAKSCLNPATLWTGARQAPLCLEFRQEYWNGLPFPSSRDLPNPGIKPGSPVEDTGRFFTTGPPGGQSVQFGSVEFSPSVISESLQPPGL